MLQSGTVKLEVRADGIAVGWVVARGCRVEPSAGALLETVEGAKCAAVAAKDSPDSLGRKAAVRNMLRHGAYKPTGRGKPASEYLVNAAAEGEFPLINNLVDVNNLVSLETLLPISLVDLERAATTAFAARWGRTGESYVFNPSGQILDLRDLLLLSKLPEDEPCASPIKDSQASKTHAASRDVLAVLYAPATLRSVAEEGARRMAGLLAGSCGGTVEWGVLP
jgi:DNA/RNA-binding domain of Phe-tRNA-synthetase-like protein